MKSLFLSFALLFTLHPLSAQTCDEMLRAAQTAEQRGAYFDAYKKYDAALTRCGDARKEEIERKKQGAVAQLERQRERAEKAEAKVKKEQEKTATALAETEQARLQADSALQKANKLVNAFYFYGERFALAYGRGIIGNDFYFIDKNGDEVSKLGHWEKVEPFDERGFAKVKSGYDRLDYLLDTFGNTYRVVYDPKDLSKEVVALDLSGKQLATVPSEVWNHVQLKILLLNQLTTLPPEIGQLKRSIALDLTGSFLGNQLTSLPPEIGQLTNLTYLSLYGNKLTTLPPEIGQLKNLTTLVLRDNQLTSLPPEIGQLEELTTLNLEGNKLTDLPSKIGQMKSLTTLELGSSLFGGRNNLTALPPEIGQLKNLTYLSLYENKLTALPPEIAQLNNLVELELRGNDSLSFASLCIAFSHFPKSIAIRTEGYISDLPNLHKDGQLTIIDLLRLK